MNDKYNDMLLMQHPEPQGRPRMSLQDRAAQFSPFAALTGYDDALKETARLTDRFIELDEDRKQEIDRQIYYLRERLADKITVRITYFVPDIRKDGGTYNTLEGCIQKIDENSRILRIQETEIPVDHIYQIDFLPAAL